jgi:hypothetical protein
MNASDYFPFRSFHPLHAIPLRFLPTFVLLAGGVAGLRAAATVQDSELVRDAVTVVTSKDSEARQLALLQVTNLELLRALARSEPDTEVRRTAILLLTDQDELKQMAVADAQASIREVAVMGIADESFLLGRVHAREESSPTVRNAIVGALATQAAVVEAAQTAYYSDVREAAAKRVTDPDLAPKVTAAQAAIAAQAQAAERGEAAGLVQLALHGAFDVVCQAAAGRLQSQDDLAAVALAAGDRDVLKIVLGKLTDPALLTKVADGAVDPAMRLAATSKAGSRTWADIFNQTMGRAAGPASLGDALAAVSLFRDVQPSASAAVTQACLAMIRQGNESRIPEMTDLLMLYGDVPLGEDYLNCGQPDLENAGYRWAGAHGYSVGRGNGSHRANWGSGR